MGRRCAADSKMNTAQALGGRQALVTGGSRGIGYAVAQRLAGLGARITLMGRDADALDLAVGRLAGQAGFVRGDIAKRSQVVQAFAQAKEAFGRSAEHTSELQSLMRISYAVFCLKKKKKNI